jgi:cyclase
VNHRDHQAALHEVGAGVYAYLQQGSWGFSNAGLITGAGSSLLVDTLYDLNLTRRMLSEMRQMTSAANSIGTVVNTHANGDHCWGNQLVGEAKIVSSRAAAREMLEVSPALMAMAVRGSRLVARMGPGAKKFLRLLGRLGLGRAAALADAAESIVECFGSFEFRGITLKPPTTTFEDRLSLTVGDKTVELIEVGPAHTKGDTIVFVPSDRIVFTGDILFIGSHPIVWEGPVSNWIAACNRILDLDAAVIVPGHGPITDQAGVRRIKEYWERLLEASRRGHAAGVSSEEIARELLAEGFVDWTESSRLVVNIDTIRRELSGDRSPRDPLAMFARMARFELAQRR